MVYTSISIRTSSIRQIERELGISRSIGSSNVTIFTISFLSHQSGIGIE